MKYLLDTQLLLWAAAKTERLPATVESVLLADNEIFFSAVSIWEIAIKYGRGKPDFTIDPRTLRGRLLRNGYLEQGIDSEHVMRVGELPQIHRDPFDRLLVAQALVEGITLVTTDTLIARYPGPIRKV